MASPDTQVPSSITREQTEQIHCSHSDDAKQNQSPTSNYASPEIYSDKVESFEPNQASQSTVDTLQKPQPRVVPSETSPLLSKTQKKTPGSEQDLYEMSIRERLSQISTLVYVLVILFGISSWIDINGLWVEVPLLVNKLPESWALPSYLVIIIQIANIGPIVYMVVNSLAPERVKDWVAVYVIICIGAVSCLLLALFWDKTTFIGGEVHSTFLIILTAFLALVDCTSSVVYLPYMAQFRPQYMTAYYIGEGLSGLIPGLVGLMQGVGSEPKCINETIITNSTTNQSSHIIVPVYDAPNFPVGGFFVMLFVMICISGISFTILHYAAFCRGEHIKTTSKEVDVSEFDRHKNVDAQDHTYGTSHDANNVNQSVTEPLQLSNNCIDEKHEEVTSTDSNRHEVGKHEFVFLLVVTVWINALMNGVLPSTQSYSCLPYGNLAYTLAVRLSTVANPLVCFSALFVKTRSVRVVGGLTVVASVLAGYQLYLAVMSPDPPLKEQLIGTFLVIVTQVMFISCSAYIKVTNAFIFNSHGGSRALLWCGGATQLGSCIGAVVIFIVINKLNVLHAEPACL